MPTSLASLYLSKSSKRKNRDSLAWKIACMPHTHTMHTLTHTHHAHTHTHTHTQWHTDACADAGKNFGRDFANHWYKKISHWSAHHIHPHDIHTTLVHNEIWTHYWWLAGPYEITAECVCMNVCVCVCVCAHVCICASSMSVCSKSCLDVYPHRVQKKARWQDHIHKDLRIENDTVKLTWHLYLRVGGGHTRSFTRRTV